MPIPQRKTTGFDVAATGELGLTQALEADRARFETDRAFKESQRLSDAEILANTQRLRENARQFNLSTEQQTELANIEAQLRADLQGAQIASGTGENKRLQNFQASESLEERKAREVIEARSDKTRRYDISETTKRAQLEADLRAQQARAAAQDADNLEKMYLSYDWSDTIEKEYKAPDGTIRYATGTPPAGYTPTGGQRFSAAYDIKRRDLADRIMAGTGQHAGPLPTATSEEYMRALRLADGLIKDGENIRKRRQTNVMEYEAAASTGQSVGRIAEATALGKTVGGAGYSGYSGYSGKREDHALTMIDDMELGQNPLNEKMKTYPVLSKESMDLIMFEASTGERQTFQRALDRLDKVQRSTVASMQKGNPISEAALQEEKANIIDMIDVSGGWPDQRQVKAAIKEHIENSIDDTIARQQLGLPQLGQSVIEKQIKDSEANALRVKQLEQKNASLQSQFAGVPYSPEYIDSQVKAAQQDPDGMIDFYYLQGGNQ